jgi:hypothetical protein
MSNFLQRIASTAAPMQALAKPRLQPMLRSIFAPAAPLISVARGPANSWETNGETETGRASIGTDLGNSDRPLTSARESGPLPASDIPVSRFTTHSEPPLLRGDALNEARLNGTEQHERSIVSRQSERLRAEESASGSESRPSEAADSSPVSQAGQMRPQQNLTPMPTQAVRAAAPPRIDAVRRIPAQRSKPDEIHIHIGRIEVAAVAPQAQRVAAPAHHKGLNLDEYLRRGSGGQR